MAFKKAVKTDATVEIRLDDAEIERIQADAQAHGKALFELCGELKNTDGEIVATSVGQYQLRQIGR